MVENNIYLDWSYNPCTKQRLHRILYHDLFIKNCCIISIWYVLILRLYLLFQQFDYKYWKNKLSMFLNTFLFYFIRCPTYNNLPPQCFTTTVMGKCCKTIQCVTKDGSIVKPNAQFPVVGSYTGGFSGFRPGVSYKPGVNTTSVDGCKTFFFKIIQIVGDKVRFNYSYWTCFFCWFWPAFKVVLSSSIPTSPSYGI